MASTTILSDNGVSSGTAGIKTTGGNDGTLQLQTTTSGGAATTAMTIDTSQNVGIGTSSPSFVVGSTGLQINGSSAPTVRLSSPTSNIEVLSSTNASYVWVTSNTPLAFGTNAAERMRIDSSGNLLVGTTSNAGNQRFVVQGAGGAGACGIKVGTNGAGGIDWYNASNTYVGSVLVNASTIVYGGTSDYRLKDNITPMTGALEKVAALNPVTYTWKVDGEFGEGFIAHELQEVCPSAVIGEKDAVDADGNPKYQNIDTSFLVATLTAAIQEQQALINNLTERLSALESK